jgi:hypothetical protein
LSELTLTQNRIEQAEFVRPVFCISPTAGTKPEDLLKPEYWTHVARQIKPGSRIEALCEDNAWQADYIVTSAATNWVKCVLLRKTMLENVETAPQKEGAKFEAKWLGNVRKWGYLRLADGEVIKEGLSTKDEAVKALASYELALAV